MSARCGNAVTLDKDGGTLRSLRSELGRSYSTTSFHNFLLAVRSRVLNVPNTGTLRAYIYCEN